MRSVSVRLADLMKTMIPLGFVGENEHTRVVIDSKKVFDDYPLAIPALTVKPPKGDAYPAVTIRDGDLVLWDVTDSDVAQDGYGEFQLTFTQNGVIAKSYIGKTHIEKSLLPTGEEPEPVASWIVAANTALNAIPQDIATGINSAMSNISADAETLEPDASATATFDTETQTLTIGVPKGEQGDPGDPGDPGYSPSASVSKSGSTATISITDANGTTTATISDGDPTTLIDDTAGGGDTGVTWSADKLVDELGDKYELPSGGIPSSDMASAVQTSLGKADTAYQKPSGGIPATDIASGVIPSVTGKADKVTSATNGNFAGLDSNGNLTDSGHKHSDYLTAHQDITGKADKVSSATNGDFAGLDSNGNLTDSGKKASDFVAGSSFYATEMPMASDDATKVGTEIGNLKSAINVLQPSATSGDVGKFLKAKTVSGGKVTEYEFGEGGGGSVDPTVIAQAVDDWLDDHPEATTTVQDGSITEKKLSEGLTNDIFTFTRNLYNKESAGAQDGKQYSSSGITDNSYYAFTGYAECEAGKTYIFKAGNANVQMVIYMNGDTLISRERIDGASFTTPANCTKVGFNLFAASHTTSDFNNAINNAQLEEGTVSTDYVPFKISIKEEMGSLYKTIHGKNLYDKSSCNPTDKKQIDNNGNTVSSDYYAVTGKIPCEGNTLYIFSVGERTINDIPVVDKVCYFNGNNFISREDIDNGSFTTPSNCNYISFNLFGQIHTTEQFEDAINTAQLEEGDTPTAYEAYSSTEVQSYSFIAQGIGQNRNRVISQKEMTDILADPWRSSWWNNKKGDSLGDSITYKFGRFQKFVKGYLKLAEFYNNGMTGTKMAGPTDPTWGDSMWMDSRINALHADADFITILGGANDSANEDIGTVSIENCDTDTYCGAFNVIISKIYYRYLALSNGYYNTVDYTGVNQLSTPKNVIIVPCTMFYVPGGIAKLKDKADAIRTLSEAWALKVCDFYGTIQANPFVANYYWGQSDDIHPTELFYKERLAPILINALEYLKPMEFRGVD